MGCHPVAVQIYTQTPHRTTEITTNVEECGPCPSLRVFTLAFALQLRKKHGKTSVRVRKTSVRSRKASVNVQLPKTPTHYKTPTNTHITKPTHTHTQTHTVQNPHTHTHTYTHTTNDMICYDMIYLSAIGLTPGGSSTVHIYKQTIHRIT
jgi:hypothetical protein